MNADPLPARHSATSTDGRVRAVVNEAGRLIDLTVSDHLLRHPPWTVAAAVLEAVTAAQEVATTAAGPGDPTSPAVPVDLHWLTAATQAAADVADQRVAQLQATIDDLIRVWERH